MGQFIIAYKITVFGNEGFFNPGNGEAETYEGLDRSQHPNHPIWPIIDHIKALYPGITVREMNAQLASSPQVQTLIENYYKSDFWDDLRLDLVHDQAVCNDLFDCNINPCIQNAARVMQEACNSVKPGALVVDGLIGPATITTINSLDPQAVFNAINDIREAHYKLRVQETPSMGVWLQVWLRRLVSYKPYTLQNAA